MLQRRRLATTAIIAGMSLAVAACGGSSTTGTGGNTAKDVKAKKGGTLKMLGGGDIDHMDTASAYYTVSYTLLRGISRQLVSYPNDKNVDKSNTIVADMAEKVPTPTNGGKTYTFKIRQGVKWDTPTGARQVTAADEVRGIKRLCNPVQPAGAPGYFTDTIVGMKAFCDGFATAGKTPAGQTAAGIAKYIDSTPLEGVKAVDDRTVEFTLLAPAGDFLNILALPFGSPAPVEFNKYVPDSPQFRQHFISDGPYKIASYSADKSIQLIRNPAWDGKTDPIRAGNVDKISITEGSDEGPVQQQLQAGTSDMSWDTTVPTADVPSLRAQNDPKLLLFDNGSTNPYIVINSLSPNAGGALKNVKVRQAINYAVNKKAIIQVLGGPTLNNCLGQILTPPILGYKKIDPYATPNCAGDPAKAKQLLTEAGYPGGLDLIYLYRNKGKAPSIASTMQAELKKSNIRLKLKIVPNADFYTQHLQHPPAAKSGDWDLAGPGWNPDWAGNAARSFFVPLLDGRHCGEGSTNYACYNNDDVNKLVDQALAATDKKVIEDKWAEIDAKVMADAPWVPIATGKTPIYRADRVKNFVYLPFANNGDITNVFLDPTS